MVLTYLRQSFTGKFYIGFARLLGLLLKSMEDINAIWHGRHINHPILTTCFSDTNFAHAIANTFMGFKSSEMFTMLYPINLEASILPGIHRKVTNPFQRAPQKNNFFHHSILITM